MPISFAFAAGAMLALVVWEMVPEAFGRATWPGATAGVVAGGSSMLLLAAMLGV